MNHVSLQSVGLLRHCERRRSGAYLGDADPPMSALSSKCVAHALNVYAAFMAHTIDGGRRAPTVSVAVRT